MEAYIRALEHRCRANNWISETCPVVHGKDMCKPWVLIQHEAVTEKRMQAQVMKIIAAKGRRPFHEWQLKRDEVERHESLRRKLRAAVHVMNIKSETQASMHKQLKSLFTSECEVEEAVEISEATAKEAI